MTPSKLLTSSSMTRGASLWSPNDETMVISYVHGVGVRFHEDSTPKLNARIIDMLKVVTYRYAQAYRPMPSSHRPIRTGKISFQPHSFNHALSRV